jgi:membrane fusion protein
VADLRIQAARESAAFRRNVAAIDQNITENEARREILIRAPHAGTISAITAIVGQSLPTGALLGTLLPAGSELEAEIYAPSRAVGFIQPGMQVLLRYHAYPFQKFGQHRAQVIEVANSALTPQELAVPGANARSLEPMYRVRLKLEQQNVKTYGKRIPLKAGMVVDASVVLDERKLYEWILEPVYSISGRL